jgi:replicative DNA helicase
LSALQSERAILGAALRSPESLELVLSVCGPDDFTAADTIRLFAGIQSVRKAGLPVNRATISDATKLPLEDLQEIARAGDGCEPAEIEAMASAVAAASRGRQLASRLEQVAAKMRRGSSLDEALEEAGRAVQDAFGADLGRDADMLSGVRSVVTNVMDLVAGKTQPNLASTGLPSLDRKIVGLGARFYVVGARPGVGKTSLAVGWADHIVLSDPNAGAVIFHLEMTKEEAAGRLISKIAKVSSRSLETGIGSLKDGEPVPLNSKDLERIVAVPDSIPEGRYIVEDSKYSLQQILAAARAHCLRMRRNGVKLRIIVVDYMQLVESGEKEGGMRKISRSLKKLSKELDCAVVGLTQLNRKCEERDDTRPKITDIRGEDGGGFIEQDANLILFIYRPDGATDAELIIAKQRNGAIGTVHVKYDGRTTNFYEQ